MVFQPTLPLRGATGSSVLYRTSCTFQPTLPLRGATWPYRHRPDRICFNPRSPCGERRRRHDGLERAGGFQPTLPLRGATHVASKVMGGDVFQPTLPLRGATAADGLTRPARLCFNPRSPCGERPPGEPGFSCRTGFNPRSPCGERRGWSEQIAELQRVSTHAPLAGSDCRRRRPIRRPTVSTHAPLAGSDEERIKKICDYLWFQPTLPLRGATATSC